MHTELEIGGHSVCPGGKVNVCWMGAWYTGTVLKVGPQRSLCKVADPTTSHTFLADRSQLKFMQTQILNREFARGTQVCYNDGEGWIEGVVDRPDAVGAALVMWRKSLMSEESENWFEAAHIAPIIPNEAYHGDLQQSRSGILPFESHQSKTNLLYESDNGSEQAEYESPVSKRRQSPTKRIEYGTTLPTSPIYETILPQMPAPHDLRHTYDVPYPPPPIPHHLLPTHPFPMVFPPFIPYGQRWVQRSPSLASAPLYHPLRSPAHPLRLRGRYSNGIPPHHSSNFFKKLNRKKASTSSVNQKQLNSPAHFVVKPSPTLYSVAISEPAPFTRTLSRTVIIPRRQLSETKAIGKQSVKKHKQAKTKTKRKKRPQLYEVPIPAAQKSILATTQAPLTKQDTTAHNEMKYRDTPDRHRKEGPLPVIASASPPNLHVFTGGRILITCLANSSSTVTYEWLKNDNPIPKTATNIEHVSPGMLDIQAASNKDRGKYSCIISNEYGSRRTDFNLQVTKVMDAKKNDGKSLLVATSTSQDSFTNLDTMLDMIKNEMDDIFNEDASKHTSSFHPSQAERPPGDGMESDFTDVTDNDDHVPELPKIVVTMPKRRISGVLRNDMEQYLGGYGEDYGVTSSATDLEMEGLKPYKPAEIDKNLKNKDKGRSKEKRNKEKRKWPGFGKKKKATEVVNVGEAEHGTIRDLPESEQHLAEVHQRDTNSGGTNSTRDLQAMSEINSIAVNTSLGSDHSLASGEDTPHVQLPLETESVSELIRRLQISTELYGPQSEKGHKVKKKSFLSALLSRSSS